ncbi:polysaccharide lyase family 8 super-sandwich domain-containing protein, partial [Streptococcus pyogenes]
TVDPYRLPGTTVTNDMREDGSGEVTLKSGFVGATQLDSRLATVAMDFNNWNDSLQARKAWFIIGDKLVFLGTDVQHSSDKGAVTTIENRKLS